MNLVTYGELATDNDVTYMNNVAFINMFSQNIAFLNAPVLTRGLDRDRSQQELDALQDDADDEITRRMSGNQQYIPMLCYNSIVSVHDHDLLNMSR